MIVTSYEAALGHSRACHIIVSGTSASAVMKDFMTSRVHDGLDSTVL